MDDKDTFREEQDRLRGERDAMIDDAQRRWDDPNDVARDEAEINDWYYRQMDYLSQYLFPELWD